MLIMWKGKTQIVNRKMQNILNGQAAIKEFFTPISNSTEIEKAQFNHKPIHLFNPKHKVSTEFVKLAKEVIEVCRKTD